MTPEEAPEGTVCTVGHPSNGFFARKDQDGNWYYLQNSPLKVDFDDAHKAMNAIWIPE